MDAWPQSPESIVAANHLANISPLVHPVAFLLSSWFGFQCSFPTVKACASLDSPPWCFSQYLVPAHSLYSFLLSFFLPWVSLKTGLTRSLRWPQTHTVAENDLELPISCLYLPSPCSCSIYAVLGMHARQAHHQMIYLCSSRSSYKSKENVRLSKHKLLH